jgi:hypothetical protein
VPNSCIRCKLDASVTIRPLIATPAQGVSRSRAETDVLLLSAAAGQVVTVAAERPPACPAWGEGRIGQYSSRRPEERTGGVRSAILSVAGTVGRCNGLRTRSLKPHSVTVSNRPTVTSLDRAPLLHQVQLDASVTIRPLIATPAQGVSRSRAETDVLQLSGSCASICMLVKIPTSGGSPSTVSAGRPYCPFRWSDEILQ